MNNSKKIIFFFFLTFFPLFCVSQITISGNIKNTKGEVLQNASIVITKPKSNIILNYTIANFEGNYQLEINNTLDSLQVNVSFISYQKQLKIVPNKTIILNFNLEETVEDLKEVIVKSKPITQRGDTLSYSVNSFKGKKDKVIADLLKRLPGIEVTDNGKILYNGKPIQKYYIEGLDLLEGKYNLANNNIPIDAVSLVQVLENHQPIKILDTLVFSERASLNIKLKKKNVLIGASKMGAGFSPFLWDINITPMLFSKKRQTLISYQTNNVGKDILNEITVLTDNDFFRQFSRINKKKVFLKIIKPSIPPFSKKYWLYNNAHLISGNHLVSLANNFTIKTSFSFLTDVQKQKGSTQTTIYTLLDTVKFVENQKNNIALHLLQGKIVLEKNTSKNYFKNTSEYKGAWDTQRGIVNNSHFTQQKVEDSFIDFNNNLTWIFPVNKKLLTLKSTFLFNKTPQNLTVSPGQFNNLLNNGEAYNQIKQHIIHSNFFTHNSISFIKKIKRFVFNYNSGFHFKKENLSSNIDVFNDNESARLNNDFKNNLISKNASFYTSVLTQYQNDFLKIKLKLPFSLLYYSISDSGHKKRQKLTTFFIEPKVIITKDLNSFWKTSVSLEHKKKFGEINQLYYGYILNSYRNIQHSNNTPILDKTVQNVRFMTSYKNPLNAIFANISLVLKKEKLNLLTTYNYSENGALVLESIEKTNTKYNHLLRFNISKYYSDIETTFTFGNAIIFSRNKQLINNKISDVKNYQLQFNTKIDTDITNWLNLYSKTTFSFIHSKIDDVNLTNFKTLKTILDINIFPSKNHFTKINSEYFYNGIITSNKRNAFFLNFSYKYTLKKIDLEAEWKNIFNNDYYINSFSYNSSLIESSYKIRPSQFTASIKFNF